VRPPVVDLSEIPLPLFWPEAQRVVAAKEGEIIKLMGAEWFTVMQREAYDLLHKEDTNAQA
jgi:hypothetical protein